MFILSGRRLWRMNLPSTYFRRLKSGHSAVRIQFSTKSLFSIFSDRTASHKFSTPCKGATIRFPGGGGRVGVFVAGKLFISTGLGGALKISHFVTCLYGIVLEVNYLFHAESARNYLFQKYSCPPTPWESNGGPLTKLVTCPFIFYQQLLSPHDQLNS